MADVFDALTGATVKPLPLGAPEKNRDTLATNCDPTGPATPRSIKEASQELLKYGLLEASRKPNLYSVVTTHREAVDRALEPLDLSMKLDEVRGLAWLVVAATIQEGDVGDDEWSHPLLRRQRLSLEQSLVVAILRQRFVVHEQEAGLGASEASVVLDDLLPEVQLYLGSLGSDAQEQKRLRNLLEQLKGHGIVSEIDAHDQVSIRPIIAHVANPENLGNLLHAFRAEAARHEDAPSPDSDMDHDEDDA
jgi:hypothetical protein